MKKTSEGIEGAKKTPRHALKPIPEDAYGPDALGDRFWLARSSAGPKPQFKDGGQLWAACCEYFEWATTNPHYEAKPFAYEGRVTLKEVPKCRAFTIQALCIFLDLSRDTWDNYSKGLEGGKRPGIQEVAQRVNEIIREQKFSAAAADLLNPTIISRDLGLAEKVDNDLRVTDERTPEQIAAGIESKLAGLAAKFGSDPLL